MADPDGVRWDEIQGICPGDELTLTISSKPEQKSVVSDIYVGLRGKRKQSGFVELLDSNFSVGQQVTLRISQIEGIREDTVKLYARVKNGQRSRDNDGLIAKVHRPEMGAYGYKKVSKVADLSNLKKGFPSEVKVIGLTETGYPYFNYKGYEIELSKKFEIGDEILISSIQIKKKTSQGREVIKGVVATPDDQTTEFGETRKVTVKRFSGSNNALADFDGREINLGPLDCPKGTQVEIKELAGDIAVCLHQKVWREGYRNRLEQMSSKTLPENLPKPETDIVYASNYDGISSVGEATDKESGPIDEGSSSDVEDSKVDIRELRSRAEDAGNEDPEQVNRTQRSIHEYSRSQAVKTYVKERADGLCEGCDEPAPFENPDGEPFLHAHHIHELSQGGPDTLETVIALCPNCHYEVHYGKHGDEYNEYLTKKLADMENVSKKDG